MRSFPARPATSRADVPVRTSFPVVLTRAAGCPLQRGGGGGGGEQSNASASCVRSAAPMLVIVSAAVLLVMSSLSDGAPNSKL